MQSNVEINTVIHILADMIYDYMLHEEQRTLDEHAPSQEGDLNECQN